jgi:lactose/L-arabinose transport system substrate-binding protein
MSEFMKDVNSNLAETNSPSSISRRTFLKSAAAGTLMSAALAACGGSGPSAPNISKSPSGQVVIWDRSGDLFQVFDATIPSFNKKYPNIKVKHVAVDVDAKLPSTLTTGVNLPDGAFYEDNNLPVLADHYYDVTDWLQPYVKDIVPFKVQVNTFGGRIKGIPFDLDPALLYYRADLLEQAGVDATKIATYDDLITASQTLQAKFGPTVKPIHLEYNQGTTQLWVNMFANQQGTSMVDSNGKLQIDSPQYLAILKWIKEVRDKGLGSRVELFSPGDIAAMDENKKIFTPYAIWDVYGLDLLVKKSHGKWRAMPLPAWTAGGARAAVMGGSSFIIPKKAKNPQLAWLFYEHLMYTEEGYKAVHGTNKIYPKGLNTLLPSYKPALQNQLFGNVDALGGQNLWEVAVSTVPNISQNYNYPVWYNQAVPYFGANIQHVIDGQMTPEQALSQAANQIQTKLINR